MQTTIKRRSVAIIISLVLLLAILTVLLLPRGMSADEEALRQEFVATAESWLGCNEADGSHQAIIDLYNCHKPLARDYTVQYTDSWCATFVSAVAIECGLTDIIPTECGCERQIQLFQALGRWEEKDDYVPSPGDLVYYSSSGASSKNNTGWADHVGIVVSVVGSTITTIEGNYGDQVTYRTIRVGDASIRGYALPNYASKA